MKGRFITVVMVTLGLFALAISPLAQAVTGNLSGQVVDENGDAIFTAIVTVEGSNLLQPRKAAVDEEGKFFIIAIPPGEYKISIIDTDGGYAPAQASIRISINQVSNMGVIKLKKTEGGGTIVNVDIKDTPEVDLNSQEGGGKLNQTVLRNVPLIGGNNNGRRYQDYLTLIPGVKDPDSTGNPYIHGMDSDKVSTTIGGASTRDPASGTFGANLNTDVIEEIEVITSAPSAEYGRALGGFVNMVTKSGGDQIAGNLSFYMRSDKFDKNGSSLIPEDKMDFSVYELAGTVSGPIIKQKLWYVLSFQDVDLAQPSAVYGGIQTRNFYRDALYYTAKLTWQITPKMKLTGEYNRGKEDLIDVDVIGGDTAVVTVDEAGGVRLQSNSLFSLNFEWLVSDKIVLRAAASHFKSRLFLFSKDVGAYYRPEELEAIGTDAEPIYPVGYDVFPFVDRYAGRYLYYGNYLNPYDRISKVEQASVSAEIFVDDFLGRHDIKGGIQYMKSTTDTTRNAIQSYPIGISYTANYVMQGLSYSLSYYYQAQWINDFCPTLPTYPTYRCWLPYLRFDIYKLDGNTNFRASDENLGFYLQDSWRLTERLVFNLGIRYDRAKVVADGFAMDLLDGGYADYDRESHEFNLLLDETAIDTDGTAGVSNAEAAAWLAPYYDSYGYGVNDFTYASWSPRFAINYDIFGDGRSKVSASWSRLYDFVQTFYSGWEGRAGETKTSFTYSNYWSIYPSYSAWLPDYAAGHLTGDPVYEYYDRHILWYVDPNLKAPYADEWTLGFERELFPNTVLKVTYVNKRSHGDIVLRQDGKVLLDTGTGDPGDAANQIFIAAMLTNGDDKDGGLQYDGVDIQLEKRIADSWQVTVAYSYGRSKTWTVLTDPRDPSDIQFVFDYAPWDVRHDLKIFGVWFLPKDFRVGWNFTWQSGYLFRREYEFDDFGVGQLQDGTNYYGDGTARTPSFWGFDLKLEKDFKVGKHSFNVALDVDDVLNTRTVLHSAGRASSGYGALNGRRGNQYSFGRRWKLSLKWEF